MHLKHETTLPGDTTQSLRFVTVAIETNNHRFALRIYRQHSIILIITT